jgi:hypothetical protein
MFAFLALAANANAESTRFEAIGTIRREMKNVKTTVFAIGRRLAQHRPRIQEGNVRRLTNATGAQCGFSNGECSMTTDATAQLMQSAPAGSTLKAEWDRCSPCMNLKSQSACLAVTNCEWGGECDCKEDKNAMNKLMAKLTGVSANCGWYGKVLDGFKDCMDATTCASVAKCEMQTRYDVPSGAAVGAQCDTGQECAPKESVMMEAVCPGVTDLEAELKKCTDQVQANAPAGSDQATIDSVINQMTACINAFCPFLGKIMKAAFSAKCDEKNTAQLCSATAGCNWHPLAGAAGECEQDMNALMFADIDSSCAMKGIMKCSSTMDQTRCQANTDCAWETNVHCSGCGDDSSSSSCAETVKTEKHCTMPEGKMYEMFAQKSCDAELSILASGMLTAELCDGHTTEAACTGQALKTVPTPECPTTLPKVQGTMKLEVADPQAFVDNPKAKKAVQKSIAEHAKVVPEAVSVTLTVARRLQASTDVSRRLAGDVNVAYTIVVNDKAAGDAMATKLDVTAASMLTTLNTNLQAEGVTGTQVKVKEVSKPDVVQLSAGDGGEAASFSPHAALPRVAAAFAVVAGAVFARNVV